MASNSSNIRYSLLVDFDFIFDFDFAIFKYIKDNYSESKYVNKQLISLKYDVQVVYALINRKNINPLKLILPKVNSKQLYAGLMNDNEENLLAYNTLYDSFFLMISYFNLVSSPIEITILCRNELESKYVKERNSKFKTIIQPNKSKINISQYNIIYSKYYSDVIAYKELTGKYIYISSARYNYDDNGGLKSELLFYADLNIIKLMDLYTNIIYESDMQKRERENNNDIFKYSFGITSSEDSKGDTWYNLRFPK